MVHDEPPVQTLDGEADDASHVLLHFALRFEPTQSSPLVQPEPFPRTTQNPVEPHGQDEPCLPVSATPPPLPPPAALPPPLPPPTACPPPVEVVPPPPPVPVVGPGPQARLNPQQTIISRRFMQRRQVRP